MPACRLRMSVMLTGILRSDIYRLPLLIGFVSLASKASFRNGSARPTAPAPWVKSKEPTASGGETRSRGGLGQAKMAVKNVTQNQNNHQTILALLLTRVP